MVQTSWDRGYRLSRLLIILNFRPGRRSQGTGELWLHRKSWSNALRIQGKHDQGCCSIDFREGDRRCRSTGVDLMGRPFFLIRPCFAIVEYQVHKVNRWIIRALSIDKGRWNDPWSFWTSTFRRFGYIHCHENLINQSWNRFLFLSCEA